MRAAEWSILAGLIALAACNSHPHIKLAFPSLLQTTPADGASLVDRGTVIAAVFSEALDPATVNQGSFQVLDGSEPVLGTVSVFGSSATFTPIGFLAMRAQVSVTIGEVRGLNGLQSDPHSWTFTVRDGRWSLPGAVENSNDDARSPQLTLDSAGVAHVVWTQGDAGFTTSDVISSARSGEAWGSPMTLDTGSQPVNTIPTLSGSSRGDAIALWAQNDGTEVNMIANVFTPAGWNGVAVIDDLGQEAAQPSAAINDQGDAFAAWTQANNVLAVRYSAGIGWASNFGGGFGGTVSGPTVAVDSAGRALVVWSQFDGVRSDIWAMRWTPLDGWPPQELVEIDDTGSDNAPTVAFDRNGDALALWVHSDSPASRRVWSARFSWETGWESPVPVELAGTGVSGSPHVVTNAAGHAIAAWERAEGSISSIWASAYDPTAGWDPPAILEQGSNNASAPFAALDPDGNAVVVWQEDEGGLYVVRANRFVAQSGWAGETLVSTDNVSHALSPQVMLDRTGSGLAVWEELDGVRNNVRFSRFE